LKPNLRKGKNFFLVVTKEWRNTNYRGHIFSLRPFELYVGCNVDRIRTLKISGRVESEKKKIEK